MPQERIGYQGLVLMRFLFTRKLTNLESGRIIRDTVNDSQGERGAPMGGLVHPALLESAAGAIMTVLDVH